VLWKHYWRSVLEIFHPMSPNNENDIGRNTGSSVFNTDTSFRSQLVAVDRVHYNTILFHGLPLIAGAICVVILLCWP
jgi:hypothetical protein